MTEYASRPMGTIALLFPRSKGSPLLTPRLFSLFANRIDVFLALLRFSSGDGFVLSVEDLQKFLRVLCHYRHFCLITTVQCGRSHCQ